MGDGYQWWLKPVGGELTNLNVMKIEIDVMRLLLGAIGSIHHTYELFLKKKRQHQSPISSSHQASSRSIILPFHR